MTYQELDTDNVERPVAASENSAAFAASSITSQADNNYYLQSRAAQESTQSLLFLQDFSISTNNDASDTKGRPADYLPLPATPEKQAVSMAHKSNAGTAELPLTKDGFRQGGCDILPKETEAQKALMAVFNGDLKKVQDVFSKLRKEGNIEDELKLMKDIEKETGIKASFDGKNLTLSMPTLDTNDLKKGISVTIDKDGKVSASNYVQSFGIRTETPISDAAAALKDLTKAGRNHYQKTLPGGDQPNPLP